MILVLRSTLHALVSFSSLVTSSTWLCVNSSEDVREVMVLDMVFTVCFISVVVLLIEAMSSFMVARLSTDFWSCGRTSSRSMILEMSKRDGLGG